jgi:hypothetical protein
LNKFSKKDIKELVKMSSEGSPVSEHLIENNYSVEALKELLLRLPNQIEYQYVFEIPYKQLGKELNNNRVKGFVLWRLSLGK